MGPSMESLWENERIRIPALPRRPRKKQSRQLLGRRGNFRREIRADVAGLKAEAKRQERCCTSQKCLKKAVEFQAAPRGRRGEGSQYTAGGS